MQAIDCSLRMNPTERMLAALAGQPVDRMPVAPVYLDLYLARWIRARKLAGYLELLDGRQEASLSQEADAEVHARAILEAVASLGVLPDWLYLCSFLNDRDWYAGCRLAREGDRLWRVHSPSGEREELSDLEPPTDWTADRWDAPPPANQEEVNQLVPLLTAQQILEQGSLEALARLVRADANQLFWCGFLTTPFWEAYSRLGFQNLMKMPLDTPTLFQYLLERLLQRQAAYVEAYAAIGVKGCYVEECMSSADMISPRLYDRFVYPYDHELLKNIAAHHLPAIFYITGDINPRLPRLVELNPSALAVEESKKGFTLDLGAIANAVGSRCALFGNLDAPQIKEWPEGDLLDQMAAQYQAARPARGFIFSMGSPFPIDTPYERVVAFLKLAQEFTPPS